MVAKERRDPDCTPDQERESPRRMGRTEAIPEGPGPLTHLESKLKESWKRCPAGDASSGREAGRYAGRAIADASIIVGNSHVATWICTAGDHRRPARAGIVRARRLPAGAGVRRGATVNEEGLGGAGPISPEQLRALAELLGLFANHVAQFLEGDRLWVLGRRGEPSWVKRAKQFVRAHLAEPLTGRQLAAMVHVSSRFFLRVFREATGLAFPDYVLEQRMERARTLLADPSVRIPEVACAAGFGSVRHFSAVFRMSTGKAPEDYRAVQRAP